MKVSLVVASGVHQGKVVPVTGAQFLIGRDATCNLRPASQAISKRHCGVIVRDGKVFIRDYGSTNGTNVNDGLVKDAEIEIQDGASLKLGPLDFTVRIERVPLPADGTPLPASTPEGAAALAAVQAATAGTPKAPPRDTTPNPARPAKPGSNEAPALAGSKEAAPLKAGAPAKPTEPAKPAAPKSTSQPPAAGEDDNDRIAAMLLGMDDTGGGEVPDGSTVMDMPLGLKPEEAKKPAGPTDEEKKKATSREDMTNAASEILRKMMRRPK